MKEVVYGKSNLGRILKMTNSQGKSKLNHVKPIIFDNHTAAAYPRLVLIIERYIGNDYEGKHTQDLRLQSLWTCAKIVSHFRVAL